MCFSEKWARNLSVLGVAMICYRILYKYPTTAIVTVAFYTVMEISQYLQYRVLDQCDNPWNQNLTKFTWFLQWVQPLMWNIVYLKITKSNKNVFHLSIALSLILFITGMMRVFNYSNTKSITHELQVKGENCAVSGEKHLMWRNNAQTFYGLEPNWFAYLLLFFVPTLWITPFKKGLYIFVCQLSLVLITLLILGKLDDQMPSTWCLLSIPGFFVGEFM
jgi:hypothetical protein